MPLHAVEAVLDATTDEQVRREWAVLQAAGLPSQANHRGESNAPHITISAAGSVPDYVETRVAQALEPFQPMPVRLGALVVMGSRRYVLARLVLPTEALLGLHHSVATAMVAAPDVPEQVRTGRWTPHVTLGRGLGSRQVGDALAVLGRARPLDGTIESVRRWDPVSGRTVALVR